MLVTTLKRRVGLSVRRPRAMDREPWDKLGRSAVGRVDTGTSGCRGLPRLRWATSPSDTWGIGVSG